MLGAIFGLGVAASFGANSVISRRGVLRASADYLSSITIYLGPVFFLVAATLSGEIFAIGQLPWQAYGLFAVAGVVNCAMGRTLSYRAVELVGSNRANTVTGAYPMVSALLAIVVLREVITPLVGLGMAISLLGPTLIALRERTVQAKAQGTKPGKDVDRRTLWLGMLHGAGAACSFGTSPIFIKWAFEHGGTSMVGSLIAYTAAALGTTSRLCLQPQTRKLQPLGALRQRPASDRLCLGAPVTCDRGGRMSAAS
ncbi:MAG: DMT family transporter [Chloroflexi bacterium]|nr:DMT family transporter [Chloroflexota bacterium]